jgi:hypothetical protein
VGRCRPVREELAEPLQAAAVAGIEECVVAVEHLPIIGPRRRLRDPDKPRVSGRC